jgi:DNA-binding transcriptional regulator YhcF (GntR family)
MFDFEIQKNGGEAKYQQLAKHIISRIEKGKFTLGEKLPSVNKLSHEFNISRETVFKAFNHLSERGIVYSKNRKGYYVNKIDVQNELRIFLLLDKFTMFKDKMYRSLYETIGKRGEVDVFFHHHNYRIFESLIRDNLANYTHFVIVTFMKEDVKHVLNLIPPEKRIILDCKEFGLEGDYSMIYQDFDEDINKILNEAHEHLNKYERLVLVTSESLYHADQLVTGFRKFSRNNNFKCEILYNITPSDFRKNSVYIITTADERDITDIIKLAHKNNYEIGKDIGIISYNDTPIKEVLEGGITVISTDFEKMGKTTAELVLNRETRILSNPSELILRKSL